jgi:hypothetical protein
MHRARARERNGEQGDAFLEVGPEPADSSPPLSAWDRGLSRPPSVALTAEQQLAALAASVGPLRAILAAIAERLLATKAHERLCYARLGDYARERAGLSARQLQDLARVHRALAELPRLERALVTNALPWSKVRLIARVASKEDEETWIARARAVATRRLEQEVRDHAQTREARDPGDEGPLTRVTLHCTVAVREKWEVARETAERVAGRRLRADEVLEAIAAEAFSALSIDPGLADEPREPTRQPAGEGATPWTDEPAPPARAPVRILPRSIQALAAGLAEADAFELDRRLRMAVRLEQTLDAAMAPLLRLVASAEYAWSDAYRPLGSYVRDQLGMSERKARTLLRLERAGDICPELREAYRSGRLSWVKAQCLLPLLLLDLPGEWRGIWVAWAERVTLRRLEADVARALLLRAGTEAAWQRCKFDPGRAQDAIPAKERQVCAPEIDTEATQRLEWRVPYEVAWLFRGVRETLRARLRLGGEPRPSDGDVFGALLDGALLTWTLRDPAARPPDPVIERDGYRCMVPGCTSRRSLHDHHVTFRSAGGSDAFDNRVTLCAFHHQRCLHAGLLRVRGRAPDALVFELGLRPGAPPLARYRSGDVALPAIEERPRARLTRAAA